MGTRTAVKICGLTRPEDVDAAVEAGADAIGFVLYPPSPRHVTPQRAAELAARLPAFVTPVLLFVNTPAEEVVAAASAVPGALLQFHGDETPADCWAASQQGQRAFLRAARIPLDPGTPPFDLTGFAARFDRARAILLDAHVPGYGGGGRTFDWSLLPAAPESHLVLSGGLTPGNVAEGIAALRPLCRTLSVDVSSGVEAAKGIKDVAKIRDFIEAVRGAS
ncbi:phosphoribosylanthranilate isomerase [Crossiella sp. SN42]|uniref:phosphoribosylanthranilate isomerase n=1 Tax=Crossiella sp. SN42 TaxID=2944808 RepID=UPI00207CE606|nr:phosphoribosylanthranilate isomerase [Crossiella sp. SN42]MCO1577262.1 phosphoribosylanthranilate isomerase [Crossiella sp. SN42]